MNSLDLISEKATRTFSIHFAILGGLLLLSGCAGPALRADATELAKVGRATLETTGEFYVAVQTTASAMLEEELMGKALRAAPNTCAANPPPTDVRYGSLRFKPMRLIFTIFRPSG